MDQSVLLSSDDSNSFVDSVDKGRNVKKTSRASEKRKMKKSNEILSTDSEDEKIIFKKVKRPKRKIENEKMLGEISLLTSDEEEKNISRRRKADLKSKSGQPIELVTLTSDEDEPPLNNNQEKVAQKRKVDDTVNSIQENDIIPAKKAKPATEAPTEKPVSVAEKQVSVAEKQVSTAAKKKSKASTAGAKNTKKVSKRSNGSMDTSDTKTMDYIKPAWKDFELLAERNLIDRDIAQNLTRLWEDGNTIPFIARYRKNQIGNMTPEELRTTKEDYDEIVKLKSRMATVVKAVKQSGKMDNKIQGNICSARTIEELEHIYAPYKPASKISLAEKAKQLGLEEPALHLLNNTAMVDVQEFVNREIEGLKTSDDVTKGIVNIIASEMSTDTELLTFLRELRQKTRFKLTSKKTKTKKGKETPPKGTGQDKNGKIKKDIANEELKFEVYFEFSQLVEFLKSHQILAINRGESLKVLTVKIEIPDWFKNQLKKFCNNKWTSKTQYDQSRRRILEKAIEDAYNRTISPLVARETRHKLKERAEKDSCRIFSENLKHLLLAAPLKGKAILGIDPGFTNGCKLALISPTGSLLAHNVVYPHTKNTDDRGEKIVKAMLVKNRCEVIGIGNGTACRETEEWISALIQKKYFNNLDVKYVIVNEGGASIYSCSVEAQKEFGNLDPNIIGAVSLARRIQDPMAELVKVEPAHLGIGMYQLDLKKKQLEEALNEVISECVSFVGVDLNTSSQCLLRRVAGLSDKRATLIIDYREKHGSFTYRRELLKVFGIGDRIFEQCAGFLRICPTSPNDRDFYKKEYASPLDATIIHPESYRIARCLLFQTGLKEYDIGTPAFIEKFQQQTSKSDTSVLAKSLATNVDTIKLIIEALSKTLNHDLRIEVSETPLFKQDITTFDNLKEGAILTGRVTNVTSFGAFVDIGVGSNGLLHNSRMKGVIVHLGHKVVVKVVKVDKVKRHIQLEGVEKCNG